MSSALLNRLVSLTRDLMLIPGTENRPHERARCIALLRHQLESLDGVEIREFDSGGFASMTVMPRGIRHPEILMVGHLDVIEHPNPEAYSSTLADGRIRGVGAGDMKGQVAIMLELFCDLQRRLPGLSLGLAFTSDEERGGKDGVKFLFDEVGVRCGAVIMPDGGSINEMTTSEKGILHLRLVAKGRESHAARPWLAPNALTILARAIVRLCDHFEGLKDAASADHWYPTCVPTILNTPNETINCIPGEACAFVDVRFPRPHTVGGMLAVVREAAGPGIDVEQVMAADPTHLSPDPLYVKVTEELTGRPVCFVRASGGSDARFIARHGIPVILTRPLVGNLHGTDEWIDVESMEVYYRICEQFILAKLGGGIEKVLPN